MDKNISTLGNFAVSRRMLLAAATALVLSRPLGVAAAPKAAKKSPDLDALIAALRQKGRLGYAAFDLKTGALVAEADGDVGMAPASTLKTVTALYALDRLGAQHRFVTRVVLDGDRLILAGGGDPTLDSDALAVLARDTATALKAQGIVPTRFEIWGGALPRIEKIVENQEDYLEYNPALSGMILNYNRVHMGWVAGASAPVITWTAEAAKSAPKAGGFSLRLVDRPVPLFSYEPGDTVEGWSVAATALRGRGARWLPVRRPELYAGDVFATLCRAQGLTLPAATVTDQATGREIARLESEPLEDIVRKMLKYSTNLTAEVLGLFASGAPDLRRSAQAMEAWLMAQGDVGPVHFVDHSGLSAESRVTARALAVMLKDMGRARGLAGLMKEEPVADRGEKPVPGRVVRAKTGTLNFVSNLAGFAEQDGRGVVFAILTDDPARHTASSGEEMPKGVHSWTARSKVIQRSLIRRWLSFQSLSDG